MSKRKRIILWILGILSGIILAEIMYHMGIYPFLGK